MPSTVGLPQQRTDAEVITTAAQLEYDCVAAYGEAAKKAHGANAEAFASMAKDCARHLDRWQGRLQTLGAAPATPNKLTEPANRWKVKAARTLGDWGIVQSVRNNSADSCEAYARVSQRADLQPETLQAAAELLGDAEKHRKTIAQMPYKAHQAPHCAADPTQG